MFSHIRSLRLFMVLLMLCLPIGLSLNVAYLVKQKTGNTTLGFQYIGLVFSYALVLLLASAASFLCWEILIFSVSMRGILYGLVGGVLCLILEYLAGVFLVFLRTGKAPSGVSVHKVYQQENIKGFDLLMILLFILLEELVFRYALHQLLLDAGLEGYLLLIPGALIFALNHLHMGFSVAFQKIISGLIFMALYIFTGSLIPPLIAHTVQNLTLLTLSRGGKK